MNRDRVQYIATIQNEDFTDNIVVYNGRNRNQVLDVVNGGEDTNLLKILRMNERLRREIRLLRNENNQFRRRLGLQSVQRTDISEL